MLVVALVAQLAITANGPDTASACLPITLTAALRAPGRAVVTLDPPRNSSVQLLPMQAERLTAERGDFVHPAAHADFRALGRRSAVL